MASTATRAGRGCGIRTVGSLGNTQQGVVSTVRVKCAGRERRVSCQAVSPRPVSTTTCRGNATATGSRNAVTFSAVTDTTSKHPQSSSSSPIYGDPTLYEMAFGFRDFDAEVSFLSRVCEKHGGGGALTSILEIGAGPAWHSIASVAKFPDCIAVAVDNAPAMIARAKERASESTCGERVAVVEGDMTNLDIESIKAEAQARSLVTQNFCDSTEGKPFFSGFDCATILLGTAAHLIRADDAISCFKSVAQLLKTDGVLVLELEHPFDLFDGQLLDAQGDAWDREVGDDKNTKVLVEWGREGDHFDVETHVVERTVGINVVDEKGSPKNGFVPVEETVRCKIWTAPEITLLGKLSSMKVVATFGDMATEIPLCHEDAHNMIVVLKRDE